MPSAGPNAPGTSANDASLPAGSTVNWTNTGSPGNVGLSDNLYCTADNGGVDGSTARYLKSTNYGFAVPAGATIDGLEFAIEKKKIQNDGDITHNACRAIKAGTVGSTDTVITWPTVEATETIGGSTSLFGTTWTVDDINNSGTGLAISVSATGAGGPSGVAYVDYVTMKVYYTSAGGVKGTQALLGVGT